MGVGGSFDVICGKLERAPEFFRQLGLEWLWRTILQPWRINRIVKLPFFMKDVLWRLFRGKGLFEE